MNIKNLPRLKDPTKTDRITIPVDKDLKEQLHQLKTKHRVHVAEWIRSLIVRELSDLKRSG